MTLVWALVAAGLSWAVLGPGARGQMPPYDIRPAVAPPLWRVRFEADREPGGLIFPVTFTAWIPPGVKTLRGVIVHQHGCGEGSCTSGLSGAWDLHWQALARKHDCGLVAPAYEQPEGADCQRWCDPRNGSAAAFEKALAELGQRSGHPELATVPWALWGHSGGGHWAGGMTMIEPQRVVAAWLRSGVPLFEADPHRAAIKPHALPAAAVLVPIMCNPGTKEGVTATDNEFKGVWPANRAFFAAVRSRGGLVGVAIDPLTGHECGNSRYLAIPWLDACLTARLPARPGEPLAAMPAEEAWLGPITGGEAVAASAFEGDPLTQGWLPNRRIAAAWMQYGKDTAVADTTPPPAPTALRLAGTTLNWEAEADLESGLAGFVIERNGERIATLPERQRNPFGRPLFQGLLYSDTPPQPLAEMRHELSAAHVASPADYRVLAVNTAGLQTPSARFGQAADGTFTLNQPGGFEVEVLQGCDPGQGGSAMSVVVDDGAVESRPCTSHTKTRFTAGLRVFLRARPNPVRHGLCRRVACASGVRCPWRTPPACDWVGNTRQSRRRVPTTQRRSWTGRSACGASGLLSHARGGRHMPCRTGLSTSCSIFLSRLRSATSCLRLRFSSSRVRSRRGSAIPSPANRFFHR
jgi:hypothetical protein